MDKGSDSSSEGCEFESGQVRSRTRPPPTQRQLGTSGIFDMRTTG